MNQPIAPAGYQLVPETVTRDGFSYSIRFPSIAPGQTQQGAITIQADSDFLVHNQVVFCDIAGGPQTHASRVLPLLSVMLIDSGSGRQLYNEALSINSQFGSGELPYILPRPKWLFSRSVLQVQITNNSAATTYNNVFLVFNGEKVFNYSHNN